MQKQISTFLLPFILLVTANLTIAQSDYKIVSRDSLSKGKFILIFINKDTALNDTVKQRLINTFYSVYPKEAAMYNKNTARKVTFVIDPAYDGVAATGNDTVRFNPQWFHKHPGDIDVVTHEVMHIVQAYPNDAGPGWITEGIADYVRYKTGIDNVGAGWTLPEYNTKQNYDNSYRITARFFEWIEEHYDHSFVKTLDAAMRSKTYTDAFCKQHSGKTFSQLWEEYAKNPVIKVK